MNYKRVYDQIIERAKEREKIEGYCERHHITPRCMGGGDEPENIVELTAREHFICHWLLYRIHPKDNKLSNAFYAMCLLSNKKYQDRYVPSSRTISESREAHSQSLYKPVYCYDLEGVFIKMYPSRLDAHKDTGASPENINACTLGRRKSAGGFQWSNKIKVTLGKVKRNPSGRKNRPIRVLDKVGNIVFEFESISKCSKHLDINRSQIINTLSKRQNTCHGYQFEYL